MSTYKTKPNWTDLSLSYKCPKQRKSNGQFQYAKSLTKMYFKLTEQMDINLKYKNNKNQLTQSLDSSRSNNGSLKKLKLSKWSLVILNACLNNGIQNFKMFSK